MLPQPCADMTWPPSYATEGLLADKCISDAAPFDVIPKLSPTLRPNGRVAVATVAHRARSTSRFLLPDQVDNATDVLPCAVIMQSLALRDIGGFGPEVDVVLVHSDWLPEQLATVAARGIKLHAGSVPPTEEYGSEFEAANMLKVDVAALTQYERVLYLDLDMLPRERATQYLEYEYNEGLVGFPGPTAPVSGQLFVIKPDVKMHRMMKRLANTRKTSFNIARGWADCGLVTWPDVIHGTDPRAQCNSSSLRSGSNVDPSRERRRRCDLSPFWVARCQRHGITNWNFMHAGSDQGLLWYAYNLSGRSSVRSLTTKPLGPDGKPLLLGLPFWVHSQGLCKPWLTTRETLSRSKCMKANAFFFHGLWGRFVAADPSLKATCPTFERAYKRFVTLAPPEAKLPCFWGGRTNCYERYRPAWADKQG